MGTCPKCKLGIRKNGNRIKLGSGWRHKMCPPKPAHSAKGACSRPDQPSDPDMSAPILPYSSLMILSPRW
jgi:hypothetical protein